MHNYIDEFIRFLIHNNFLNIFEKEVTFNKIYAITEIYEGVVGINVYVVNTCIMMSIKTQNPISCLVMLNCGMSNRIKNNCLVSIGKRKPRLNLLQIEDL